MTLQPELLYSLKGSRVISHPAGGHPDRNFNLYYLNLPLLLNYKPLPKLSFVAGPEAGLLLLATSRDEEQKAITVSDLNRIDLGAAVGVTYKFMPALSAELRYTHGFISLGKYEQATNRTFQLGFAYYFVKE